jgi:nucleoside-diphosphate-sugar epimerase
MTKIIVLGASGAMGKHVAQQAVDAGHEVSVVVRTPSKLPASWRDKVKVHKPILPRCPQVSSRYFWAVTLLSSTPRVRLARATDSSRW